MAKSPRSSLPKTSSKNFSSKWLKNAIKSIGISTNEVIKDIAPNLHEVTSAGVKTSAELVNSLRRNTGGVQRVSDTLQQNKYVQYATKAYKNALADIKSGNFNNTERMSEAFNESMMNSLEEASEGFSFGDAGDDTESNNVNVNYIAGGDNSAVLSLGQQIQKQAVAQTKMAKANMDAYIAVSSAGMQQIGQLGSEIINHLSNINNNLSAMVQYNNENMTKFIEASLAYYDQAGAKLDNGSGIGGNEKITAASVLNGGKGGINLSQYKAYVKQQTKKMLEDSDVGFIKSIADDPMLMEMAVSNPLGFLSKGLTSYMMPKILKTSLESMEETFSNFMPTLLSQLSELANDQTSGFVGGIKRSIGKMFGLSSERITTLNGAEIERGAIPFDGETKHAITEIITKELRSQTGYLKVIANHFDKNADKKAEESGEYWDWNSNSYIKKNDIDVNIANQVVDAITDAFESTKFGKSMQSLVDNQTDEKSRKEMDFTLREIYTEIEKQHKNITIDDLISIINATGSSGNTKRFIKKYVRDLQSNDVNSFNSVNIGRIQSQQAANEVKQRIKDNPTEYHLTDSAFGGTEIDENGERVGADFDRVLSETMGYGKNSKGGRYQRRMKGARVDNVSTHVSGGPSTLSQMVASASNHATDMMQAIMSGDASQIFDRGTEMITDQIKIIGGKISKTLFGEKDESTGQREGGIFAGFSNSLTNAGKELKWMITGKGYDSEHPDNDDAVFAQFKKAGDVVKDGIMSKLFGKKKNENGEYVKDEEKSGIFGSVVNTFKSGFNGWMDAFFGTENSENPEEGRKNKLSEIKDKLQKDLPYGMSGAAIGAGVGLFSSGSLLGTIVGGPIAGAAMGAAGGFLARNEKFQNYLFGEKDDNGERVGGLISKNTQDFMKKNKDTMIAGGTIGAGVGLVTGGGVLGSIVGGPIAGALLGTATSLVVKSKTFQEFLFGNEEEGKEGIIKGIKNRFQEGFKKTRKHGEEDSDVDATKLLGMSAIGAGTGGLLGMMVGGPVVGALTGLALSIKASSGSFKEFLFGKEDGLTLADGTKTKKQGLFGKFGNMLDANVMQPLKTEVSYIVKDFNTTLKHDLLGPISGLGKFFAGKAGELFGNITNSIQARLEKVSADNPNSILGKIANAGSIALSKGIGGIMEVAYKGATTMLKTPVKFLTAVAKAINLKDRILESKPVKAVTSVIKTGVNGLFKFTKGLIKDTFNLIMSPFKLLGKGIKGIASGIVKGAKWIGDKTGLSNKTSGLRDKFNNFKDKVRANMDLNEAEDSKNAGRKEHKANKAERNLNRKINKNNQLIAKWTKGQFAADSEEARLWLMQHDKDWARHSKQLDSEAAEVVKQRNIESDRRKREARDGKSSLGMSESSVKKAPFAQLSDEAKQVNLLARILEKITGKKEEEPENENQTPEFDNATGEKFKAGSGQKISDNLKRDIIRDSANGLTTKELSDKYNIPKKTIEKIVKTGAVNEKGEPDKNVKEPKGFMGNTFKNIKDFFKFFISKIRGHAKGGDMDKGEIGIVGEEGPEIIETKSKTRVHPFNVLKNMVSKIAKKNNSSDKEDDPTTMGDDLKRNQKKADEAEEENKAKLLDASKESMDIARDRAKTAKELQDEKEREEEKRDRKAMLAAAQRNAEATEKHSSDWKSIFSKKGLITLALGSALAWAAKNFPGLIKNVGEILGKVGNFVTDVVGGAVQDSKWTEENKARTNGNSKKEQAKKDIEDIKNGNILTDSDGNATNQTNARMKLIKSEVKNFVQSGERHLTDSKYTRLRKKGYEIAKTIGGKTKSLGGKIKNKILDTATLADIARNEGDEAYDVLSNSKLQKYGAKAINKVKDVGQTAIKKATDTKVGGAVKNIATKTMENAKGLKTSAKTIGKKAVSKVKNAGTKLIDTAKKSKTGGKILDTVISYITDFFKLIASKFKKKAGVEVGENIGKVSIKGLSKVIKENWGKWAAKITAVFSAKVTVAGVTLGLSDVVFATLDGIDGLTGTAKLFQVDSKKVDGKMRAISTILGVVTGTTVGSVLDVVFALIGDVMGFDILHEIAVGLYNLWVGHDSDKAKDLQSNMQSFKDAYKDYQEDAIREAYESQLADGTIDPSVSYEDFVQGVQDGTYKADYKSFQDWNVEKNASVGDKIIGGVGKVVKGTGKALKKAGNAIKSGAKKIGSSIKSGAKKVGSVIKKGASSAAKFAVKASKALNPINQAKEVAKFGKWLVEKETKKIYRNETDGSYYDGKGKHYSASGEAIGGDIEITTLSAWVASGLLKPDEMVTKESGLKQIWNKTTDTFNKVKDGAKKTIKNFTSSVEKGAKSAVKALNNFNSKFTENLVSKKEEAWYMKDGSGYYRFNGHKYIKCTINGDPTGEELTSKEFKPILESGILEKGEDVKVDSKAAKWVKGKAKSAWNKVLDLKDKAISGLKKTGEKAAKTASDIASGAITFFYGKRDTAWYFADNSGYLMKKGKGYAKYSLNGDLLTSDITEEQFKSMMDSGLLQEGQEIKTDSTIKEGFKSLSSKIKKNWSNKMSKLKGMWSSVSKASNSFVESVKKDGFAKTVSGFFKKTKETAWYRIDGAGYYVLKDEGSYTYYNMNGDVINDSVKAKDVQNMIESGTLTQGEIIKDSKAQEAVKSITSAVRDAWDKAKNTVTNKWDDFKKWITGGKGTGSNNTSTDKGFSNIFGGSGKGTVTSHIYKQAWKQTRGGKGPDGTYYSQNDERWKNAGYNTGDDSATMGDTGCGPTAMAMAASDVTGKNINPMQMASLAKATGNRDQTGTNWNFINDASNMMGMQTTQVVNPTKDDISASLDTGNPVILSGVSGGNGSSDPYTKAGHYVVATGKDSNGNVMVKDPRGQSYNRHYNINDIASSTGSVWSFGGRGNNPKHLRNKVIGGGFGVNRQQWIATVKAVKAAYAAKSPTYHADNNHNITITVNGKNMSVRPDCSGLVSTCLKCYGVLDTVLSSRNYANPSDSSMSKTGFTSRSWPGWENLSEGDIIARNGHVEIFAYNEGKSHYVYNGGSTNALQSAGATRSGHSSYTTVWSPGPAGSGAVDASAISSDGSSGSDSSVDTSSMSGIGSLLSSFLTNAATGILSGDTSFDFSSPFKSGTSDSNDSSGEDSGSVANISASNSAIQRVFNDTWQYEMGKKGPGCYAKPLNDGAGWNYGIASFTQKWAMDSLLSYLGKNYPNLRKKLSGKVGTAEFNKSWAALGKSDEQEFYDAQLKFLLGTKLVPAVNAIKTKAGVNLNNGKYSEGVFSLLLSMANQRPAWTNERWVPYLKKHPNASSEDIINSIGGDLAKNYSGNYAKGIKNRYSKQVANSLRLTTPFNYTGGGFGDKNHDASITNRKFYVLGGKGKDTKETTTVSGNVYDVQSKNSSTKFKKASKLTAASNDPLTLIKEVIEILTDISNNTSASSNKLDNLSYLKNISNSNNIIVSDNEKNTSGTTTKTSSSNKKPKGSRESSKNKKRAEAVAYAIAKGGI